MVAILRRDESFYSERKIKIKKPDTGLNGNLRPVQHLVDLKMKKNFVKKFFQNNVLEFENFIQSLEAVRTWPEALTKVNKEFENRQVDRHSREAVLFTDMLYKRYYPDDNQVGD